MDNVVLLPLLALFGLAVGSFLNVVIVRVPSGESIVSPPSKCPQCEAPIATRDNIPVVSWLLLRGRCRSCSEPIPAGYPLVEAANALLWVLAGLAFEPLWQVLTFAVLFSILLALSVIDMELQLLPNAITYPTIVASLVAVPVLAVAFLDDPGQAILRAYAGGLAYSGFLFVVLIAFELVARKEGMGFGDVKLAVILGIWLGLFHPLLILFALIFASFLGLFVGVGYFVVRRKSMPFPFGPWLAIGTVVVLVYADRILDVYGLS